MQEELYRFFLELKEIESWFGVGPSIFLFAVDILLSISLGPLSVPFEFYEVNGAYSLPMAVPIIGSIWIIWKGRRIGAAACLAYEANSPYTSKSEQIHLWTENVLLSRDN